MKKYSTLLSALFSCISTANAFTSGPSAVTKHQVRRSTRLGMDTSRMSTAELQKIARERGYDTVGMDRTGLEMIARGWADIVKTRPQQQGQYYEDDVLDVTGVEYSQDGYGLGNQQPQNRPSSSYGNNQPQIPQSTDRSSSPQGDYGSGRVDTQPRQQRQQPQREQPQQQQSQKSFPFFQPQGTSNNPTNNSQMDLNQNRNQYNGKRKIPFEDSLRAAAVGFFGGGFAVTPVTYLHNFKFPGEIITNEMSQFQFDTFTGAISAAAFAAVYRYFVKEQKDDVLANGVIAAFIIAKSFGRVKVSYYCEGLYCGEPLLFMDWAMLQQAALSGLENLALFGAAALVVEYFCDRGYISRVK